MRHPIHALLGATLASMSLIGNAVWAESLVPLDPLDENAEVR